MLRDDDMKILFINSVMLLINCHKLLYVEKSPTFIMQIRVQCGFFMSQFGFIKVFTVIDA